MIFSNCQKITSLFWLALVCCSLGDCRNGPSGTACYPVFHSRYGMWIDPCHAIIHVARNWHADLNCNGPFGLSIVGATYGPLCKKVDSHNKCVDACQSRSVGKIVRLLCGSNQVFSCRVRVRDVLFENPCPDEIPTLSISFTCDYFVRTFNPNGTADPSGFDFAYAGSGDRFFNAVIRSDQSVIQTLNDPNDEFEWTDDFGNPTGGTDGSIYTSTSTSIVTRTCANSSPGVPSLPVYYTQPPLTIDSTPQSVVPNLNRQESTGIFLRQYDNATSKPIGVSPPLQCECNFLLSTDNGSYGGVGGYGGGGGGYSGSIGKVSGADGGGGNNYGGGSSGIGTYGYRTGTCLTLNDFAAPNNGACLGISSANTSQCYAGEVCCQPFGLGGSFYG